MIDIGRLLKGITEPVMGCTEPAALALASSLAVNLARGGVPECCGLENKGAAPFSFKKNSDGIESMTVRTSKNLFKNAMSVGIPNTDGQCGIELAAALGAYLDPSLGLGLLKGIDPEALASAHTLIGAGRVDFEVDERDEQIFIEARAIVLEDGQRHIGEVIVRGRHDGLSLLRLDGCKLLENRVDAAAEVFGRDLEALSHMSIQQLIELSGTLSDDDVHMLLEGAALNLKASERGLELGLGLGVGAALSNMREQGSLGKGIVSEARIMTAAACDARMSGDDVEIMASGGSGNQGIMIYIPATMVAKEYDSGDRLLGEALALGQLITAVMTHEAGLLGGMCGCVVKAGLGAAVAVARLLSDKPEVVEGAINNMAANIIGEICDGAKVGCALKLSTAAGTAVESALMSASGLSVPSSNGIVGRGALETLESIGKLARSMRQVDRRIVEIMSAKV